MISVSPTVHRLRSALVFGLLGFVPPLTYLKSGISGSVGPFLVVVMLVYVALWLTSARAPRVVSIVNLVMVVPGVLPGVWVWTSPAHVLTALLSATSVVLSAWVLLTPRSTSAQQVT